MSTTDDYWAFVRMLLEGGTHEGVRVIAPHSIERMITDHQPLASTEVGEPGLVVPGAGVRATSIPAGFGWDGGTGTTWRSDVDSHLTGILFTHRPMASPEPPPVFVAFWECAYAALAG